jgi:hypothetical protein
MTRPGGKPQALARLGQRASHRQTSRVDRCHSRPSSASSRMEAWE